MLLSVVYAIFRVLLDALVSRKHRNRELEILVLRHQLSVLQRTAGRPRLQVGDRFVLAALAQRLPRSAWRSLLVRPDTVIRWHRQLVNRKWAFVRPPRPPRPAICLAAHARSHRQAGHGQSNLGYPRTAPILVRQYISQTDFIPWTTW